MPHGRTTLSLPLSIFLSIFLPLSLPLSIFLSLSLSISLSPSIFLSFFLSLSPSLLLSLRCLLSLRLSLFLSVSLLLSVSPSLPLSLSPSRSLSPSLSLSSLPLLSESLSLPLSLSTRHCDCVCGLRQPARDSTSTISYQSIRGATKNVTGRKIGDVLHQFMYPSLPIIRHSAKISFIIFITNPNQNPPYKTCWTVFYIHHKCTATTVTSD